MGPIVLWLDVVSRVVHVSTAIVLVGGAGFFGVCAVAFGIGSNGRAATDTSSGSRLTLEAICSRRHRTFLASGFYNYFQAMMPKHKGDGLYHGLMAPRSCWRWWCSF